MADSKVVNEWLNKESSLLHLLEECEFLNAFYIDTRYPVHWPTNYTKEKAFKAKDATQKIAEAIKEMLKEKI